YNLNIRRYVDNTPEPEPEDVQAHLIGGIPQQEVEAKQTDLAKFGILTDTFFQPDRPGYLAFIPAVADKANIKITLEGNAAVQKTFASHHEALESWWNVARNDFAQLRGGKKMPEVRHELLTTLKSK